MAKQQKTAAEIEELILKAAARIRVCDGLTGVTVQAIDDERVDYNWTVSQTHNCDSELCQVAIQAIVDGAQKMFDLKT